MTSRSRIAARKSAALVTSPGGLDVSMRTYCWSVRSASSCAGACWVSKTSSAASGSTLLGLLPVGRLGQPEAADETNEVDGESDARRHDRDLRWRERAVRGYRQARRHPRE